MDSLAARAESFLAEHTGSGRVVKNQAARRKALLDTQHKKRAEIAARNRGIVAAVLGGREDAETGPAFGEQLLRDASGETDAATRLPSSDLPVKDEMDVSSTADGADASLKPGKAEDSAREERLRFVSEFSVPEVSLKCYPNHHATAFHVGVTMLQWMLEVPSDLNGRGVPEAGWLVLPRPEGKPVFVVAARCVPHVFPYVHVCIHVLKGLDCRARVTPASSHASPRFCHTVTTRRSFSRTLLVHAIVWKTYRISGITVATPYFKLVHLCVYHACCCCTEAAPWSETRTGSPW